MKKVFLFFVMYLVLSGFPLSAQELQNPLRVIPKSPDAASLDQFINVPVNTGSGLADVSIPIFTFSSGDFSIPVTLSYHGSGIKVNDIASQIGLGWSLQPNALISRNIIGLQDDMPSGGWFYVDESDANSCDDEILIDFYKGFKDVAPDVFTYNFFGNSGSFFFNRNRDLHKSIDDAVLFDIPQNISGGTLFAWDKNGNYYEFGKRDSTKVVVVNTHYDPIGDLSGSGVTGWRLTKIITPIKDTIYFEYQEYTYSTGFVSSGFDYTRNHSYYGDNPPLGGFSESRSNIFFTTNLIQKIESKNQILTFIYEDNENFAIFKKRLKKIKLADKFLNVTKTAELFHSSFSPDLRIKLDSVKVYVSDNESLTYSFAYSSANSMPAYSSFTQDIFGYINNNTQFHMIPVESHNLNYFDPTPAIRDIDHVKIKTGILEEIVYPTGGKTKFFYDPNVETIGDITYYAPGVRIKSIEYLDENNFVVKKTNYVYSNLKGIKHTAGKYPFHYYRNFGLSPEPMYDTRRWSSSPIQSHLSSIQFYYGFGYQSVETHQVDPFSDSKLVSRENYSFYSDMFNTAKPVLEEMIFYNQDGLALKRKTFNYIFEEKTSVYSNLLTNSYPYRGNYTDCNSVLWCSFCPPDYDWIGTHYQPLSPMVYIGYSFFKSKETQIDYFPESGDSVVVENYFLYNDYLLPSETKTVYKEKGENTETLIKRVKYPPDYNSSTYIDWLTELNERYIIGLPIDIRDYRINNNEEFLIQGESAIYNHQGQLAKNYVWEANIPEILDWDSTQVIQNGFELQNEYTYDPETSNLIYVNSRSQQISIYWAYNSQYPVVKAENVSYDSLIVAISAALPTGYSGLDELLLDVEGPEDIRFKDFNDNLRDHPLLINGVITTYTYLPLLGVTSQTDPNGFTTYYEYDGLGRLIKVLDNDRNVLQEYKYNYANQ